MLHGSHDMAKARAAISWRIFAYAIIACCCLWFLLSLSLESGSSPSRRQTHDAFNSTLGFERIFAMSMPGRTDRRDALVLSSSLLDFDVEIVDGVDEKTMVEEAKPFKGDRPGMLGCWRAHLNLIQKMVYENLQTALFMEDDTDFDVTLKDQLAQFAEGARAVQSSLSPLSEGQSKMSTPYGHDWDMLWLGHCSTGTNGEPTKMWVIEDDPTVAPIHKRHSLVGDRRLPDFWTTNHTRVTFKATAAGMCTYAYAMSNKGARKALAAFSVIPSEKPIDMLFQDLCKGLYGGQPFDCYTTYPPIFNSNRPAGPKSRDTDIEYLYEYGEDWHKEYTFNTVYSTRMNVFNLLAEGDGVVHAQWPKSVRQPTRQFGAPLVTGKSYLAHVDMRGLPELVIRGINDYPDTTWISRPTTIESTEDDE